MADRRKRLVPITRFGGVEAEERLVLLRRQSQHVGKDIEIEGLRCLLLGAHEDDLPAHRIEGDGGYIECCSQLLSSCPAEFDPTRLFLRTRSARQAKEMRAGAAIYF